MQEKNILSREQVLFLIFIGIIGNIVYVHTWIDNDVDRASWLAALCGILLLIPLSIWLLYIADSHPKSTFWDIIEADIGKIPLLIIVTVYTAINVLIASSHLNMFTQMLNVFFLPNTPRQAIFLFLLLVGSLIVTKDIQIIGRLVEILAVTGLINYFLGFIFAFPKFIHIEYVIPVFDTTIPLFLKGSLFITSEVSECLLLLMVIVCYIPDPFKHRIWVVRGIILSAVIFSLAILIIMAMISPELAKRIAFGGVNAAYVIHKGEFIHGLELLVFSTYQFIAIGRISLCMYCILASIKKIFNTSKNTLPLLATVIFIYISSMAIGSYNNAYYTATALGTYIILPFTIFLLLIVSFSNLVKNKKKRRPSE